MPETFFSRLAAALGARDGRDMRAETRTLVQGALSGDEVQRERLRGFIDEAPSGLEEALRDATREVGMRKRVHAPSIPPAAARPAVSPHWETRETYEGDQSAVVIEPLRLYHPETLADLVFIVKEAERLGHGVKALGAGCSYSGVNTTNGFLADLAGLDAMLPVDAQTLRSGDPATLRRFEAGARIGAISEELAKESLAIENMGGFLPLSFVGAAMTGTHGSGIRLGNMAGQIVSMVVVGSGGRVFRVEPDDGITDPDTWDEPGVDELEQSDTKFHAMRVSMGAMGLVYSVTIQTVPLGSLREVRWEVGWREARKRLADRTDLDAHEMVEVYVNPYATRDDGDRTALITIRSPTTKEPKGAGGRRRLLPELLERLPVAGDLAMLYLNLFPKRTPGFVDSALRGLADAEYIAPRYEMLADEEHPNGFAMELAFSMKDDGYLDRIEEILDRLEQRAADGTQYVNMLSIRFVAASRDHLSMHYDADDVPSCTVEFPTLSATTGARETFADIQRAMLARGARPHWALEFGTFSGNGGLLEKMYPQLGAWRDARLFFDATGVFANEFTDRMGFTVPDYQRD